MAKSRESPSSDDLTTEGGRRRDVKYDDEIRRRALGLLDDGQAVREIAKQLGVSTSTLYRWRKQSASLPEACVDGKGPENGATAVSLPEGLLESNPGESGTSAHRQQLLEEYKILVDDLHHVHNIHHTLLKYTLPSVAVVIGVSYQVPIAVFLSIVVATIVFTIMLLVFYERMDYLIFLKFTRLVELDTQLGFYVFRVVRSPPWDVPSRHRIGKKISQMRLYRGQVTLVVALLAAVALHKLIDTEEAWQVAIELWERIKLMLRIAL